MIGTPLNSSLELPANEPKYRPGFRTRACVVTLLLLAALSIFAHGCHSHSSPDLLLR